jgi:5-methyltetrahydrofolate--homocysteine methyltransferase
VLEVTAQHHPMYVGLAANFEGPAATREKKHQLAQEIVEEAGQYGVEPGQIFVDMNVFPLGSESDPDMNFALESLEAIPLIKSIHPDLKTICGVGNLSNGLGKKPYMRKVLTSVWLDEGRKRGLDAAIVNPNHYVFVEDLDKKDYDLALRAILERDMEAFEELEEIAERKSGIVSQKRDSYDDLSAEEGICEKVFDGHKRRAEGSVTVDGHEYPYLDTIVEQAAEVIERHEPLTFINDYLMATMQRLGDGFGRGEISLPHLLKSADVMKQVMSFLESYMKVKSGLDMHSEIQYKGTIVLGTVYQDVHSIGKDLAKTLFENYGYRVIDMGVMTPLQGYIDAAKEHNADAIGMSALLVQTSNHMITVSRMLEEQGMADTCVLVGGAPVSDRHAAYVAMAGRDDPAAMRKNVFYCATAMDGVNVMNELLSAKDPGSVLEKNFVKLKKRYERAVRRAAEDKVLLETLDLRTIAFNQYHLPENPWFSSEKIELSVEDFIPYINRSSLYSLNWRFGGRTKRSAQGMTDEKLDAMFDEWVQRIKETGWLKPQGLFGVYPCYSEGNDVVVLDVEDHDRELFRFDFTTVIGSGSEDTVNGAHYYRRRDSQTLDAIGIQISSAGPSIDDQLSAFKTSGDTESALYLQGFSDRLAEDMAEYMHVELRKRLSVDKRDGTRWSPGYPGMQNMDNNRLIHELLGARKILGVKITEAGEFHPTGCTAAVISFHPDARYS